MIDRSPIAIVGMACRFPGAEGTASFWENILRDACAIAPLPPERFHRARYYDPRAGALGKSYSDLGGIIEDHPIDLAGLRIPPKLLESTDIAHLWALEVADATFRDAGYTREALHQRNIGVVIGHARGSMLTADMAFSTAVEGMIGLIEHTPSLRSLDRAALLEVERAVVERVHARYPVRNEDGGVGTMASGLSGLVSHVFGLTGRHMVVDAACASSFAALDIGVRALLEGRLELALCGGASYSQELSLIMFAQSRALSPDGSFPFDRRANGFISSDGIGFVLLKRLEDAERDGDRIHAVIRGIGGSCDGKGKALWAPRKEGQVLALEQAYASSKIDPSTIGLIEAHATSTPLGDLTEIEALEEFFGGKGEKRPLPIGSVKGNIGHCREAAGAAGLIKAILALEHGVLPPTGNFREPSREIPWSKVRAEVITTPRPWATTTLRRAGVNAFGIGGLNYHVILEEAPTTTRVFPLSSPELGDGAARLSSRDAAPCVRAEERLPRPCDIAIVGLGGIFPGARSVEEFWRNLSEARDITTEVPEDRWSTAIYYQAGDRAPYRTYAKRGAFITGFAPDWKRFKMPPKLVERNDPLQFMLLESALDALEDAGIEIEAVDRSRVAVVVGSVFGSDYALELSLAIRALELAEVTAEVLGRGSDHELVDEITRALRARSPEINEDSSGSFSSSTLASRTAKTLDLMGPSFAIDAACASSLASLETACEMLRSCDVDVVLYGGGDRAMRVQRYEAYCQFYALSRTDRARPFDEHADGFLPGEGAAMCVLKRLEDARSAGDHVYAVIKGIGSSADGERKGLHRPSARGLARAMRRALAQSDRRPDEVSFIECHGAGTPVGDATEVEAVLDAYSPSERRGPLILGSVKGNVGHTQGAAGVIAVVKAALALERGQIPPTLGFSKPHPLHPLREKVRVTRTLEAFPATARAIEVESAFDDPGERSSSPPPPARETRNILPASPSVLLGASPVIGGEIERVAAVSSMGLAGINYHVILERSVREPEKIRSPRITQRKEREPPRSAASDREPRIQATSSTTVAGEHPPLASSAVTRMSLPPPDVYRLGASDEDTLTWILNRTTGTELLHARSIGSGPTVVSFAAVDVRDLDRSIQTLRKSGFDRSAEEFRAKQGIFVRLAPPPAPERVAFMFSGQGSQYGGMMRALRDEVPEAEAVIERADAWLTKSGLAPLSPVIFSGERIPTDVFLIQAATLSADLMAYEALVGMGIEPDVVTGHSFGDYAALVAARAWTLEDALHATRIRAQAIADTTIPGGMISVAASIDRVEPALREARRIGYVGAANINAPDQTVIAGTPAALEAAAAFLEREHIEIVRLDVPRAFHSDLMQAARDRLADGLGAIAIRPPEKPYLSSITRRFEDDPKAIRRALIDQLTEPVNYIEQVRRLVDERTTVFLECGPRAVLAGLTRRIVRGGDDVAIMATDDPHRPGRFALARISAMLDARTSARSPEPRVNAPGVAAGEHEAMGLRVTAVPASEPARAPGSARDAETARGATESAGGLTLLDPETTARLASQPGFESFWKKTRPSLEALLSNLWAAERTTTERSEAEREPLPTPSLAPEMRDSDAQVAAAPRSPLGTEDVGAFVVSALCAETGYPPDLIEPDADLEADLGIDTVKQAQVLGKVRDRFDLRTDEKRSLRDFPTLSHIVRYVEAEMKARATKRPPKRTPVSVIDLTERRRDPGAAGANPSLQEGTSGTPRSAEGSLLPPEPLAAPAGPTFVEVLHLSGTAREIGRQHGEAMREAIRAVMARYEEFIRARARTELSLPSAIDAIAARLDRAALEELEGITEAAGVPFRHLVAYNLDAALFPAYAAGCTQIVRLASENAGTLLHFVNEDSPLLLHLGGAFPRVIQIRRRTDGPDPERRTVLFSLAGQSAGPNGASDIGLTATSTTLLDGGAPSDLPRGLPHPLLVKRVLEEATSLESALMIARAFPRAGRWSLLFSDAEGDRAAYLEYDGDAILLEERCSSARATTNHALSGAAPGCSVPEHSLHRAKRAERIACGASPISVEQAKEILRDLEDGGRGRAVAHPTMNTIRRVDNVMSLVVEPASRRLHVTDRVLLPGSADAGPVAYLTIDYARSAPSARGASAPSTYEADERSIRLEDISAMSSEGAGIVDVDEIMRRHVIRVVEEPPPPAQGPVFSPGRAVIHGEGDRANAIAAKLRALGGQVLVARTVDEALSCIDRLGGPAAVETLGVVADHPAEDPTSLSEDEWERRRLRTIDGPFHLLRAWAPARETGTLFGVTLLGGGLGFENAAQGAGDGGALLGLLKAIRREFPKLRIQALDASASEPPDLIAERLVGELDCGSPRLEIGLLRGKRVRLALAEHPHDAAPIRARASSPERLPRAWVVTGGARGVTARLVERLADLYQPAFHLIGKHQLHPREEIERWRTLDARGLEAMKQSLLDSMRTSGEPVSPLAWRERCDAIDKSLEIDRSLRAIAARGSSVHYHQADAGDRRALSAILDAVRKKNEIEGIIHGAGVEIAKSFDKKSDTQVRATIAAKLDGIVHLLHLTERDPVTHVIGFSSVSGRFGGHGQTDYSLANEAMARVLSHHRAQRPDRRVSVIDWPAFSEVGLAARSSARVFLERTGQSFMTPAEGANHFVRELWAGLPEAEVTFSADLELLDLDRASPSPEAKEEWKALDPTIRSAPLIDHLVVIETERCVAERRIYAVEPFLDQHRMAGTPILPAVVALEMLSELAALGGGDASVADMTIRQPLKVADGTFRTLFLERTRETLRIVSSATRSDGVVLEPARVYVTARRAPPMSDSDANRIVFYVGRRLTGADRDMDLVPYPYPRTSADSGGTRESGFSRMIFHGPVFRSVEGVWIDPERDGGAAKIVVPATEALISGTRADSWRTPSALLDGCLQAAGLIARLLHGAVALPHAFGRVFTRPRGRLATGERVTLEIKFRPRSGDHIVSDFVVHAADGPLLVVEGYAAQIVPESKGQKT